jgi:hypothetical protein
VIRTVIAGSFFCPCISIYYHLTWVKSNRQARSFGDVEPIGDSRNNAWRLPTRAPHRRTATARRPSFRNHSGTRFVIGQNNYSG